MDVVVPLPHLPTPLTRPESQPLGASMEFAEWLKRIDAHPNSIAAFNASLEEEFVAFQASRASIPQRECQCIDRGHEGEARRTEKHTPTFLDAIRQLTFAYS